MNISTNSWHYKLICKYYRWAPSNLCPYMRRLFLSIFKLCVKWAGIALGSIFGAMVAIFPILVLVDKFFVNFLPADWLLFDHDNTSIFMLIAVLGMACYTAIGIVLGCLAIKEGIERYKYSDFHRNRVEAKRLMKRTKAALPPKTPSVFVEWVKAIHNRTCASLEFVEEPVDA